MKDMCLKYADYVIKLANEENKKLSNTMLQKILFYAYVDYAVEYKEPLFSDSFYAWDRGPVLPEIYNKYSIFQYGVMKINGTDGELTDESKKKVLRDNYKKLIDIDISKIVSKTHKEGSPWKKHYSKNFFDFFMEGKDLIPYKEIFEFYIVPENYDYLNSFN